MSIFTDLGKWAHNTGTKYGWNEYKVSEKLGFNPRSFVSEVKAAEKNPSYGPQSTQPSSGYSAYQPRSSGNTGQVLGRATDVPYSSDQLQQNEIQAGAGDDWARVNREYDEALNVLGASEGEIRQEAAIGEREAKAGQAKVATQIGGERDRNIQGLEGEETETVQRSELGLRDARDLFRDMEQRNTAKLSALGISSSSVTAGLAEKLGVETARRISGITGSRDEIIANIGKEKLRVKQVFEEKMTQLAEDTEIKLEKVRFFLQQGINKIGAARGQAAVAKANARADILSEARSATNQILIDRAKIQEQFQKAAQLRQSALEEAQNFSFNPSDMSGLQNQLGLIQNLQDVGLGGQVLPQALQQGIGQENLGLYGQGPVYTVPGGEEEDDIEAFLSNL